MRDDEIITKRDLFIARAIEAQDDAADAHYYMVNCLKVAQHADDPQTYITRASHWQHYCAKYHQTQAECVEALLKCQEDYLDREC
jgi:hypothetical protein